MRLSLLCLTAVSLVALAGCATSKTSLNGTSHSAMQEPKTFACKETRDYKVNYLLYLPKGYGETPGQRWPMIFFLHGAGERGTNIWKVAVHGPPKQATNMTDFPFIVVSPQCPEGQIWSSDVLSRLLDDVTQRYAVDTNRVYLTGLSMGGYGTWNLGLAEPERFAAMAPICGGGQFISVLIASRSKTAALKSMGIWAFHGAKDSVVPLSESQRMVDALKRAGMNHVKFTIYPEADHNSWTETYQNPDFYKWLLEHKRNAPPIAR